MSDGPESIEAEVPSDLEAFRDLERRDWQLWSLTFLAVLVMAAGVLACIYPERYTTSAHLNGLNIPTYFVGLCVLTMLLCSHLAQQELLIKSMRRKLLAELVEQERLRRASLIDPLTQVYNRRFLEDVVGEKWRKVQQGQVMSLIVVDLDNFKVINDTQGHQKGDEMLRWTASLLKVNLRKADLIFRTGGDEFLILLETHDPVPAVARIRAGMEGGPVGLTLGIASWDASREFHAALHEADEHMLASKPANDRRKSGELPPIASIAASTPDKPVSHRLRPSTA